MKTLTIDELEETEEIKVGETFIYVDGFNKEHKIKVQPMKHLTIEETCKKMCVQWGFVLPCCVFIIR